MSKIFKAFYISICSVLLFQQSYASTAIFSPPPKKPFKHGFAYSQKECESFIPLLKNYKIKKEDVVADVGAGNGWREGVLSVLCDSVKFYIQDINSKYLNRDQLNKVIKYYSSLRSTPQTNSFTMVLGSEKRTELPDHLFDKIIIHNSFHEFTDAGSMVKDLATKLKPGGEIIVSDQFSNDFRTIRHQGCGITAEQVNSMVNRFASAGLYLTGMAEPENSLENHLHFEFNKQSNADFNERKNDADAFIKELDKFNLANINSDSITSQKIAIRIKSDIVNIMNTYPLIEKYLNSLGYALLRDKQIKSAINVLRANTILFPESSNAYDSLGEACLADKNYSSSLTNYKTSLELDADNENAAEKIKELSENH